MLLQKTLLYIVIEEQQLLFVGLEREILQFSLIVSHQLIGYDKDFLSLLQQDKLLDE